jgi:transposase-like protein
MMEFMREFPDDTACLDYLWRTRYAPDGHTAHCPKCDKKRRFHRVKDRPSYDCDTCGHHIHPTAGTIYHKSSTSLHLWFYAAYMITSSRRGVSAKTLERELGVTYKTAWRMFNLIRNELMSQDDDGILGGEVEVDETFIKGRMRNDERRRRAAAGIHPSSPQREKQAVVFGAVERGGPIRAIAISDSQGKTLLSKTIEYVLPRSLIYTDEWVGSNSLDGSGTRTSASATSPASTSKATRTRKRLTASSDCSRTASAQRITALAQVAAGLPERVRVALEPPRGSPLDVSGVDRRVRQ